jgi:predicted enzyme related to lactoylglutathione lyase
MSDIPQIGRSIWYELMTPDIQASRTFDSDLFGLRVTTDEMADLGKYWLFHRGEKTECGMMPLPEQASQAGAPPHKLSYAARNVAAPHRARDGPSNARTVTRGAG